MPLEHLKQNATKNMELKSNSNSKSRVGSQPYRKTVCVYEPVTKKNSDNMIFKQ